MIDRARARGAASVAWELAGTQYLVEALGRFGFRYRGQGASVAVSPPKEGAPHPEAQAWYFLLADEDYN